MTDLTKANEARLNAALDKKYQLSHGVDTFRGMIAAGAYSHGEAGETPSVKWDRRKYNRMDHRQQAEYSRKLDTMKPEYRLFLKGCPHWSFHAVPKMLFDYYMARSRVSEKV